MDCYKKINPQLLDIKDSVVEEINKIGYPIKLHIFFHRDSKRRFDYTNVFQLLSDALVKNGLIEDDDASHITPVFEGYDTVDKEDAGCTFWINKLNEMDTNKNTTEENFHKLLDELFNSKELDPFQLNWILANMHEYAIDENIESGKQRIETYLKEKVK